MSEAWRELVRKPLRGESAYHVPAKPGAIKLDANESPFDFPAALLDDIAAALRDPQLHRYPEAGAPGLRALLAARLGVEPQQISVGNGSDETLALLLAAFGESRDGAPPRVLYGWPGFVVYRTVAYAYGFEPVEVPFAADFSAQPTLLLETVARTRPNVVFLATPNNPTGTEWPRATIEQLVREFPDVLTVVDEAYLAYSSAPSCVDLAKAHANCLVVQTLSKIGMAGLRIGYAVGRSEVISELEKVRPPYNLDTLSQRAACVILGRHAALLDAHAQHVVAERARLGAALRARGLEVFPSGANFFLVRTETASALAAQLREKNILVRSFDRPGTPLVGCLRVTVGTPAENDALLTAL